jgi:LysR family glycine cleavage system transcriptional activator
MHKPLPPFKSLLAFDAAARLGSFSKAAEELSLTQSAVSQQLLKLEESVGQSLFFRNGKGVGLTAAGELLHETVRETLVRLAAGLDRIEPYKSKESLLIACPADFAQGWLMPRVAAMRRDHPGIEIWFITERTVREIDRIDVDLVISRRPIHTADVECAPLLEDYSVALCGPLTAQMIGQTPYPKVLECAPLLMLESEPQWDDKLSAPTLKKIRITRGATMDDSRLLLEATMREQGISYMSHAVAAQAIQEKRVQMLPQIPTVSRQRFWLMRTRLTPRTPFANLAFQWLLKESRATSANMD